MAYPVTFTVVGILYIVLSAIFFTINLVLLVTMTRNPEYHTATYRIIRFICIACMLQLGVFFIGGVMTITDTVFSDQFNRILGAIIQASWFLYLGLSFALAVDRLLCFVVISPKKCAFVSFSVLVASWLLCIGYLVAFLFPGFGFAYCCRDEYLHWFYMAEDGALILKHSEIILDFVILSLILFIYFVVFCFLIKMRKVNGSVQKSQSLKSELRILFVSTISYIYECTYLLWFFWGSMFLQDDSRTHILTTFLWIIDCGLFSMATLIINSSVRRKVKTIIVSSRATTTVTTKF